MRTEFFIFAVSTKSLIIKGGFNIHPDEINEILRSQPDGRQVQNDRSPGQVFRGTDQKLDCSPDGRVADCR